MNQEAKQGALKNLELELAGRTARLRAHHATLAQSLLTRGEMRISRLSKHVRTQTVAAWITQAAELQSAMPASAKRLPLLLQPAERVLNLQAEGTQRMPPSSLKRKASTSPQKPQARPFLGPQALAALPLKRVKPSSTMSPSKNPARRTRTINTTAS